MLLSFNLSTCRTSLSFFSSSVLWTCKHAWVTHSTYCWHILTQQRLNFFSTLQWGMWSVTDIDRLYCLLKQLSWQRKIHSITSLACFVLIDIRLTISLTIKCKLRVECCRNHSDRFHWLNFSFDGRQVMFDNMSKTMFVTLHLKYL